MDIDEDQRELAIETCPSCGSGNWREHPFVTKKTCRDCGHVFL